MIIDPVLEEFAKVEFISGGIEVVEEMTRQESLGSARPACK